MKSEHIENIESIGEVVFRKNARAKNLRISIRPYKGILVTVPRGLNFSHARKFVFEKQSWIEKSLARMKEIEDEQTFFTPKTKFSTKYHQLEFIKDNTKRTVRVRVFSNKILVTYHPDAPADLIHAVCLKGVEAAYRKEAKEYLPKRLKELSDECGLKFKDVRISKAKKRWGSCSSKNNINLSLYLMRLPNHLIDYVLYHELSHVRHKNHGKDFYKLLDKLVAGKTKELEKELKKYRPDL